jgi:alanyl-tRNA synthetase
MLTARQIRQTFLSFFADKGHQILPSAPIVNRNDPTLLFTNAGMNPFKDIFLGNQEPAYPRVADTQKCLRVSGKHNDLEEVGVDSYHHTMFEMLGNWSFGDYFKEEAIAWAWELLTRTYGLDPDRLFVTVFAGDPAEGLEEDLEAAGIWEKRIDPDRVLRFGRKDNFWEMGDTGPCGPCSEIHVDLRTPAEREAVDARTLVNRDHPLVVEIWNLVFIQYNRLNDGRLEPLPARHVDTGMGFERLVMALQGKQSNYDTDVFTPLIGRIAELSGIAYTGRYDGEARSDVAMRVMADHVRAVAFTIADGELPASNGAGYVIRRILRRAVRYGYSFLGFREPVLYQLVPILAGQMKEVFPELAEQESFVGRVIMEEERAFLRTLEGGLRRLDLADMTAGVLDGATAFELYDTFGFPIDLTRLIGREKGFEVDEKGFESALERQKERSRSAAGKQTGDWTVLLPGTHDLDFLGYDTLDVPEVRIIKYREVEDRRGHFFQIVLDRTPFYPEGGGQVGDTGLLIAPEGVIRVEDTQKENDLVIHLTRNLPADPARPMQALVDADKRRLTENNHSATHLLHAALREVLGEHVRQKGSMLNDQYLRFDFAHFQKVSDEELERIEQLVNRKIRENIPREEARSLPMEEARAAGAMMLFGEKYGETVRMITFGAAYSRELCGGCHVPATGQIGMFRILSESAVAAGVRRIEAVTADAAEAQVRNLVEEWRESKGLLKAPGPLPQAIATLLDENRQLRKQVEQLQEQQAQGLKHSLRASSLERDGVRYLVSEVSLEDPRVVKNLIFQLDQEWSPAVLVLVHQSQGKPMISVHVSRDLADQGRYHAGQMVRTLAAHIQGGGGGQPFYATAGGKDASGIPAALAGARTLLGLS